MWEAAFAVFHPIRAAANAVDVVVRELNRKEAGVPPWPRMLLFPGRWVAPVVVAARAEGRG